MLIRRSKNFDTSDFHSLGHLSCSFVSTLVVVNDQESSVYHSIQNRLAVQTYSHVTKKKSFCSFTICFYFHPTDQPLRTGCNEQLEHLRTRKFQPVIDNLRQHLHDCGCAGFTVPHFCSVHLISAPPEEKDHVPFHDQHQCDFFGVINRRLRRHSGYGF